MGKKANERRKKIIIEVLGELPGAKPKRQQRTRKATVRKEGPVCCYDKFSELPANFIRCYGCPKESECTSN